MGRRERERRARGGSARAEHHLGAASARASNRVGEASAGTEALAELEALYTLMAGHTGWIRIVPQDDGKTVFLKWKWLSRELANKYVMYVCKDYDYTMALRGLLLKVLAVERGLMKPVEDSYYGDR